MKLSIAQKQALDPTYSCWVEASAGTGKTTVLIDRVLSLLLFGVKASDILCLTFTKAAGAEMENRLRDKLHRWAILEDVPLRGELLEFLGHSFSEDMLKKSRGLFKTVLGSSYGIRIQTIHGFCQSLLRAFPLEAGLFPHFKIMTDTEKKKLIEESSTELWKKLKKEEAKFIASCFSEDQFHQFLQFLLEQKEKLHSVTQKELRDNLRGILGFNETQIDLKKFFQSCTEIYEVVKPCAHSDVKICQELMNFHTASLEEMQDRFQSYKTLFLTAEGTVRKKLFSKEFEKKFPDISAALSLEAERVFSFHQNIVKKNCFDQSSLLGSVAIKFVALYESVKLKNAWIDYDDLILRARDLLRHADMKPWILEKLDYKLNHILVDEAQDTSQIQWDLVLALIEEFCADNDQDSGRTFFVVGDLKQSIYSFQGACPKTFMLAKKSFQTLPRHRVIDLSLSYRATPTILDFVDRTFSYMGTHRSQAALFSHEAARQKERGIVEIWPLFSAEKKEKLSEWDVPRTPYLAESSRRLLAQKIASQLKEWFDRGEFLESKNRPLEPKDIMILVRRRDAFMEELIKALKENSIPVTGVDRIALTEQLVIKDLLCLCDVLLLPEDDLSLAVLLKSPLFGWEEKELFDVCQRESSQSLWDSVLQSSFSKVIQEILELQIRSKNQTPYSFFSFVLNEWGGKNRFLKRLGPEIEDVLEEFLLVCLSYEETQGVDLQQFVYWMREQNIEVKRSTKQTEENQVRVMTVHGAKGLQSPIVFLPDTTQVPVSQKQLIYKRDSNVLIWADRETRQLEGLESFFDKSSDLQEYYRLLYVAMTRAEDRLYISGWGQQEKLDPNAWYAVLSETIKSCGDPIFYDGLGTVFRYGNLPINSIGTKKRECSGHMDQPPKWLTEKWSDKEGVSSCYRLERPLSDEQKKGNIIHKILQWMVYQKVDQRSSLVKDYIDHLLISDEMKVQIKASIRNVLSHPEFCHILEKQLKTEVPILGYSDHQRSNCIIDLLAIDHEEKTIQIVDYKTGVFLEDYRLNPPSEYKNQLGLYKNLVQDIYPGYKVLNFLFWIDIGWLQPL